MNEIYFLIIVPIALLGFVVAFILQFRLHHYVSKEKVLAVEDVSRLWKNSMPPKFVLNEKGLKLYLYFQIGGGVFVAGCLLCIIGIILGRIK